MSTVTTKEELEAAKNRGEAEIVVEGELANQIRTARPLSYVAPGAIAVMVGGIAAAPFTFGASLVPAAIAGGVEVAAVIVAVAVGLTLILAVWQGYEEVEFDPGPPPRVKLRKKSK